MMIFFYLLTITIIPLQYGYSKQLGKNNSDQVLVLAESIASEKNSIVDTFYFALFTCLLSLPQFEKRSIQIKHLSGKPSG